MAVMDFGFSLFYFVEQVNVCMYGHHGFQPLSVLLTFLDK